MKTQQRGSQPATTSPLRGRLLGALAGLLGIGCCIYPVALVLLGLATAAEAVALGNVLYGAWGWIFKIAGGVLAIGGIVLQLRKRGECSVAGARRNWRYVARVGGIGLAVYVVIYAVTKLLASWSS